MESFRNACNRYISMMHSSGMRQHQIAFWWRNRIPMGCIYVVCHLQAFRFSYAPFRFAHYAQPSLHTCLHTSNPYGIFFSHYHYATNGVRPSNLSNF